MFDFTYIIGIRIKKVLEVSYPRQQLLPILETGVPEAVPEVSYSDQQLLFIQKAGVPEAVLEASYPDSSLSTVYIGGLYLRQCWRSAVLTSSYSIYRRLAPKAVLEVSYPD
jgi:hypothetical protein